MADNQVNLGNLDPLATQSLYIENAQSLCIEKYGIGALSNATKGILNVTLGQRMCPAFFDGIMCWPTTPANKTAEQPCPTYVVGFDKGKENASRFCTSSGQWYVSEHNHAYWTNYTQCYGSNRALVRMNISMDDEPDLTNSLIAKHLWSIKTLSRIGYSISLLTLIIAFIVMFSIKKLHCPRNKLHMHLFASFIFRAFISLLKDALFIQGIGLASDMKYRNGSLYFYEDTENNNWSCKLLTSLWEFFITANYSWILMEGVYLHNLIFRALFSDTDSNLRNYIIFGWGAPALVIIPWTITRATIEDTFCWTTHDDQKMTFLILSIPVSISILVNFVLFIKITTMIMKKLRSSLNAEAQRYKKWARSTLVLVPLFGVHYAVFLGMSFSMGRNQTVELIWLFCDQLFASSQGFFVAILYCFLNGEVRTELKLHFYDFLNYWGSVSCCYGCCAFQRFSRSPMSRPSVCTMVSNASICNNGVQFHGPNHQRNKHEPGHRSFLDHTRIHFSRAAARSCQDISPKRKYLTSRFHNGFLSYKSESASSENRLKQNENPAALNMEQGGRCQSDPYICKEMICMLPTER